MHSILLHLFLSRYSPIPLFGSIKIVTFANPPSIKGVNDFAFYGGTLGEEETR